MACAALPSAHAQSQPDGSDINKAIPIFFGQDVSDIGDHALRPSVVYQISLARGQQFNVVANTPTANYWYVAILSPSTLSLGSVPKANVLAQTDPYLYSPSFSDGATSLTLSYQVPAAGTYFVLVQFGAPGVNYTLRVSAQGTPLLTALPTQAGCLNGSVNSITYSLQLIAVNLPDTVTIGGTQACASCAVKPPLYSQIVDKLESALKFNLPVQACYDGNGNIFQISLQHP